MQVADVINDKTILPISRAAAMKCQKQVGNAAARVQIASAAPTSIAFYR